MKFQSNVHTLTIFIYLFLASMALNTFKNTRDKYKSEQKVILILQHTLKLLDNVCAIEKSYQ